MTVPYKHRCPECSLRFQHKLACSRRALLPDVWREFFLAVRDVPGRGLCCVQRFAYTCGLIVDATFDGLTYRYAARYCYPNGVEARRALSEWDGEGDPPGEWIKEKLSERSRIHEVADDG